VKVLVTGAAGRIGRRVVDHMTRHQFEVIAVDHRPLVSERSMRIIEADLVGRPALIERLLRRSRPDVIVHLAALAGSGCERRPAEAHARNVILTDDLARCAAALRVPGFVFASTCAVYHQERLEPTRESENIGPTSVYGRTKLAAESMLTIAAPGSVTAFTTLRIFNVHGPGMDDSLWERLRNSTPENPVELIGWENFYRDWLHVDEVARAVVLAVLAPGRAGAHEVVNIGSGVSRNNAELVDELLRMGVAPSFFRSNSADAVSYSWADVTRAAELVGYRPHAEFVLTRY
jgi:nucleoside-diphosphate-sugar epimerase